MKINHLGIGLAVAWLLAGCAAGVAPAWQDGVTAYPWGDPDQTDVPAPESDEIAAYPWGDPDTQEEPKPAPG